MGRVLIDTHVFIWSSGESHEKNIGKHARSLIGVNEIYVSSISFAEITVKKMLGKIKFSIPDPSMLAELGVDELPFLSSAGLAISNFESLIGHDPFDRMLLAQARSEGMIFLTADEKLLDLGLDFVVDARV